MTSANFKETIAEADAEGEVLGFQLKFIQASLVFYQRLPYVYAFSGHKSWNIFLLKANVQLLLYQCN